MAVITETIYIQGADNLYERLKRIDQIIDALELNLLENIGNSNIDEYSLDDGQVKIKTIYRSTKDISNAIDALEKQKQRLLNQLNGRNMVLRAWQGLN